MYQAPFGRFSVHPSSCELAPLTDIVHRGSLVQIQDMCAHRSRKTRFAPIMGAFSHHISSSRRPFSFFSLFIYFLACSISYVCLFFFQFRHIFPHLDTRFVMIHNYNPCLRMWRKALELWPCLLNQKCMKGPASCLNSPPITKKKNAHDANQNIISTLLFFSNVSLVRLL